MCQQFFNLCTTIYIFAFRECVVKMHTRMTSHDSSVLSVHFLFENLCTCFNFHLMFRTNHAKWIDWLISFMLLLFLLVTCCLIEIVHLVHPARVFPSFVTIIEINEVLLVEGALNILDSTWNHMFKIEAEIICSKLFLELWIFSFTLRVRFSLEFWFSNNPYIFVIFGEIVIGITWSN